MKRSLIGIAVIAVVVSAVIYFLLNAETSLPRPRGYYRIELPAKAYTTFESICPFSAEVPKYSKLEMVGSADSQDSCRFNLFFPRLNARIHCTYLPVGKSFDRLISEAYGFAAKHEMKASGLKRTMINDDMRNVHGIIYDIEGDAASQIQFFMTDSAKHFFRGSLYFYNSPNPDSIAPVLSFIREDIVRFAETLRWRE